MIRRSDITFTHDSIRAPMSKVFKMSVSTCLLSCLPFETGGAAIQTRSHSEVKYCCACSVNWSLSIIWKNFPLNPCLQTKWYAIFPKERCQCQQDVCIAIMVSSLCLLQVCLWLLVWCCTSPISMMKCWTGPKLMRLTSATSMDGHLRLLPSPSCSLR